MIVLNLHHELPGLLKCQCICWRFRPQELDVDAFCLGNCIAAEQQQTEHGQDAKARRSLLGLHPQLCPAQGQAATQRVTAVAIARWVRSSCHAARATFQAERRNNSSNATAISRSGQQVPKAHTASAARITAEPS